MIISFLDLPVYRLEQDTYIKKQHAYIEEKLYQGNESLKVYYENNPDIKNCHKADYQDSYGGSWEYNEIIGYIRLHFMGVQIRGEYWTVKAQRIVRTRKKIFHYKTYNLVTKIDIPENASDLDILKLIQDYVNDCRKELQRFIDDSKLLVLGPYIQWRALIENEAKHG